MNNTMNTTMMIQNNTWQRAVRLVGACLAGALLLAMLPGTGWAEAPQKPALPFLSPMFSDNMVLQRGMTDAIWGWTAPGAPVDVTLENRTAHTTADLQGRWVAHIGPFPAGGPYDLSIKGPENVTLHNVLIGDVWVCSGQSNMQFGMGNLLNPQQEIAAANYPEIRLYTVPDTIALSPQPSIARRDADLMGQWSVCTPQTVSTGGWGGFSAVGYFFGRDLYQALHVPIGLIHTSWGGTVAEAWTSAAGLEQMPDFRPAVAQVQQEAANQAAGAGDYGKEVAAWYARYDPGSTGTTWADPGLDTTAWKTMNLPTNWEAAGLPGFDGVVWFRKTFDLSPDAAGKDLTLSLGPIDDNDTTYVNGIVVGATEGWDKPRTYRVPNSILKPGQNVIAVRVLDTGGNGGIYGKPEQLFLDVPGGQAISLAGPWLYQVGVALAAAGPAPMRVENNPNVATVLYNGMIAPVIPFGIKGVIWYQGESNAGRAYQYRQLLPTMIQDWRRHWGEGPFPFLIVQLANFMNRAPQPTEDSWAELREAQLMTTQKVPKTGMATIIDIGDALDIHPKDKQDVGKRLALAALAIAYGRHIEYSGPLYRSMDRRGNAIRLHFTHVDGGLAARGGPLVGFAIAGPDRHFVWADARIQGDTIVVSSPQVAHPVAVRYAWAANPAANLYNQAGLPASPFRTDSWPGVTANAH